MDMKVEYAGKRAFRVKVRGHEFTTDLPEKYGGEDKAPNATETFIGAFGACVALFAARYLETAKFDPSGLAVDIDWDFHPEKKQVGYINMKIKTPNADLGPRKKALLAAAGQCTIHNTLLEYPDVNITLEGE